MSESQSEMGARKPEMSVERDSHGSAQRRAGPEQTERDGCSRNTVFRSYLLARYIFETLGYRRYEWKCDALNAASRRAALRYGFVYEGTFRQYMIAKGRNRDNAWFSMLDSEWPDRKRSFERWLAPENFDSEGRQRTSLAALKEQKA